MLPHMGATAPLWPRPSPGPASPGHRGDDGIEENQAGITAFLRERRSLPPEAAARLQGKRDREDRILEGIERGGGLCA